MNDTIDNLLKGYPTGTQDERKNTMREICQKIILRGLSEEGLFEKAAFMGGTALRIYYGLDRFSEDLDFALVSPDDRFDIADYFGGIRRCFSEYGLNFECRRNSNPRSENGVMFAEVKANLRETTALIFPKNTDDAKNAKKDEKIRIYIETYVEPPLGATFETRHDALEDREYDVRIYDKPSIFASKIYAVVTRQYDGRFKGRDLYDYLFLLDRGIPVNMELLGNSFRASKRICVGDGFTKEDLTRILEDRFRSIPYDLAIDDVISLTERQDDFGYWDADFFTSRTKQLLQ